MSSYFLSIGGPLNSHVPLRTVLLGPFYNGRKSTRSHESTYLVFNSKKVHGARSGEKVPAGSESASLNEDFPRLESYASFLGRM